MNHHHLFESLGNIVNNYKESFIGTGATIILGFIGHQTLSDLALLMTILAGAATAVSTVWHLVADYKKNSTKTRKPRNHANNK